MAAVLIIVAVVVILLVVVIGAVIGMYNSLVKLNIKTDESWSGISVQLKRRADLIPNLVETVKGYAAHESGARLSCRQHTRLKQPRPTAN